MFRNNNIGQHPVLFYIVSILFSIQWTKVYGIIYKYFLIAILFFSFECYFSFMLICNHIYLAGKPTPAIQWARDNIPIISETYETPGGRSVKSDITIGPLGRQDLNSRLSCKAINHPRATPLESTVQIDMNCKYKLYISNITEYFVSNCVYKYDNNNIN